MENNNEAQAKSLKDALLKRMENPTSGELPDEVLEKVSGGAVLGPIFYIAKCYLCDWNSPAFDYKDGDEDIRKVAKDHENKHPDCDGLFDVFGYNTELGVV